MTLLVSLGVLYQVSNYSNENIDGTSSYPRSTTILNVKDLMFPMTLIQIPKFEKVKFGLEMKENDDFFLAPHIL